MNLVRNLNKFLGYSNLFFSSIKKRGFFGTVKFALYDLAFDIRYKTDTLRYISLEQLTIHSPNKEHGFAYSASNSYIIKIFFEKYKNLLKDSVFIDFGCGRGKVLIVASLYGCKKVIGIDFAKELLDRCEKNISQLKAKRKITTDFELVYADAATFKIPKEANIFFFYNPFDETILSRVIENIKDSLREKKREILIAYVNPLYKHLFEQNGFTDVFKHKTDIIVYNM